MQDRDGHQSAAAGVPLTERRRLTVAIPTYNGRQLLEVVLPSLRSQTLSDFHVIVVDDASTDDTRTWMGEHWPEVELVVHERNSGVTAALNTCLRSAHSEYVCLLNNDIELDPHCLAEMMMALESHSETGVVCAKLIDYHNREFLDGTGDIYNWGGVANRRGQGKRDQGQYDEPCAIFGACAGAAIYRSTALQVVGEFDERFFALYEDVDWSFRAQLAGWDCRYVPSAIAYHMGSATLGGSMSDFTLYHNWRNAIWVIAKNYPLRALLLHIPELAYVQIYQFATAIYHRRFSLWFRVWRDALAGLPRALRLRRIIQRSRRRSLAKLDQIIKAR